MKKIELIKQTRPDKTIWFTNIDNKFVENSLELTEEKARKNFEWIKIHGTMEVNEVIEVIDIE